MAQEYFFKHHLVEARRNRFRLGVSIGVIAAAAAIYLVPSLVTRASSPNTLDLDGAKILNSGGGQYGGTSTGPFSTATVTAKRVLNSSTVTASANPFSFSGLQASAGEHYFVSVSPVTVGGYTVKGLTWCADSCEAFDAQATNFRSGSSADLTLSPNHSYHIRWIYQPIPTATPTPAASGSPGAQAVTSGSLVPGNFQALVAGDNALVTLSWIASFDPVGIKSYKLERSIDRLNWTVVAGGLTSLSFRDDTVAFGVHYYYRLSATNMAGAVSAFATTEATTGQFTGNSNINAGTYTSDDQIANVDIPAGALNAAADCTVVAETGVSPRTGNASLVVGPYALICKDLAGSSVDVFNKPVTWRIELKNKLKGFVGPWGVTVDAVGNTTGIAGSTYDDSIQEIQFNQTNATTTAVLASTKGRPSLTIFLLPLILIAVVVGVFILVLRSVQKKRYNDYLRHKYYDL